jgi:hypothetical protein
MSKVCLVRTILRDTNKWTRRLDPLNNRDFHLYSDEDANLPIMDPVYHFYMHCLKKNDATHCCAQQVAGPNLCFMDAMYNRWAVQNAAQLRQRILARKGMELGVTPEAWMTQRMNENEESSENVFGKRGARTSRALQMMRRNHHVVRQRR